MQNLRDSAGWSYRLLADSRTGGWPGDGAGGTDPATARPAHGQHAAQG